MPSYPSFPPRGGDGESLLLSATVIIPHAQILTLPTTGVEIVPAPGAGKIILPTLAHIRHTWNADYTNIAATAKIGFDWLPVGRSAFNFLWNADFTSVDNLLGFGESCSAIFTPPGNAWVAAAPGEAILQATSAGLGSDSVVNAYIGLWFNNAGAGNLTGGDPANTLKVTVWYVEVDV